MKNAVITLHSNFYEAAVELIAVRNVEGGGGG